jgi:hypothetical protein
MHMHHVDHLQTVSIIFVKEPCLILREPPLNALTSHDRLRRHRPGHAVWVHLGVEWLDDLGHESPVKSLLLGDRAVLVGEQQCLQVDDFLPQLSDLCSQSIVLTAEHLHLGLQVGQPLLFALTTFECRNTVITVSPVRFPCGTCGGTSNLPVPLQKVLALLFIGHLCLDSVLIHMMSLLIIII